MALMRPLSVICLGLLYMLTGCSKEEVPKTLPRVGVQQVQPTDFAARVTLTGDVQARVQTDLSFRVGGKIISRSVDVGDHVKANQVLVALIKKLALQKQATPAQVALAWLLAQRPWIVPIPGTTKLHRLEENLGAANVRLTDDELAAIAQALAAISVTGDRYPAALAARVNR